MQINIPGFEEFPPTTSSSRAAVSSNPIFVTVRPTSLMFSRGVNAALENAARVKVLFSESNKQFILKTAEEGEKAWTYLKEGRDKGAYVIWQNKDLLDKIKDMLPDGRKNGVRINGKKTEDSVLFDCTDLGEMRKFRKA